jgi:hypothetical protein
MSRRHVEQGVERVGACLLVRCVDHRDPPLQEVGHLGHIGVGAGQIDGQAGRFASPVLDGVRSPHQSRPDRLPAV